MGFNYLNLIISGSLYEYQERYHEIKTRTIESDYSLTMRWCVYCYAYCEAYGTQLLESVWYCYYNI